MMARNTCPGSTVDLVKLVENEPFTPGGKFEFHITDDPSSPVVMRPDSVGRGVFYAFERSNAGCYSASTMIDVAIFDCTTDTCRSDLYVTYTVDKELMGKEFLVKDSLPKLKWKMEAETRQIGGYNCFKATAVVPANKSDFRNYRLKKQDDKKEPAKQDDGNKTNFMDGIEMPKEITITAWYTPDIPVNQGPESYWGLPGLILEINDGKTIILCSKIVINPKDKADIKPPTGGKEVSQKEYDEIMTKKMEEMQQMYQSQGGHGTGGGQRMRIGG
ncbi:MAG: GLPGLI family protein [Flavobacterium sp.]|nr:MAG: GLPGLI family protein [Flavobacterium sp.]